MTAGSGGWTIDEYRMPTGERPVVAFLQGLTGRPKTEAGALIRLLAKRGNALRLPHSKALGRGLFELRGHQVRLFYVFRPGRRISLLDGMLKKRDEIPPAVLARMREIQKALVAEESGVDRGP
jgi:hypothetical protein